MPIPEVALIAEFEVPPERLTDYAVGDRLDLPNGDIAGVVSQLVGGVWRLVLPGDGDIILLPGVIDADGDGTVLDQLLLV